MKKLLLIALLIVGCEDGGDVAYDVIGSWDLYRFDSAMGEDADIGTMTWTFMDDNNLYSIYYPLYGDTTESEYRWLYTNDTLEVILTKHNNEEYHQEYDTWFYSLIDDTLLIGLEEREPIVLDFGLRGKKYYFHKINP